jgi:hypothetical protein
LRTCGAAPILKPSGKLEATRPRIYSFRTVGAETCLGKIFLYKLPAEVSSLMAKKALWLAENQGMRAAAMRDENVTKPGGFESTFI